ncbi:MAG TPA: hypothetical protein VGV61_03265 [Thermoanaerobaculia bacterium]|jgi:hypothetical protein|nr:hypothetical protein [Thermoanaerobaculia bacterium]
MSRTLRPPGATLHRSWLLSLVLGTCGVAAAQQVTLPLPQYEELRARAHPPAEETPPPPAPFALESAEVTIVAGADNARVSQALDLVVYGEGEQSVPLGEAGSLTAARFGALAGRVGTGPEGWTMVARGRGRWRLTLESVVTLQRDETATRPTWRLALRLPPAALVRGRVTAPAAVEEVELAGDGLLRGDPREGWSFVVTPGKEPTTLTLRGRRTLPETAKLPLRFDASAVTDVTLSRTRMRVHGWVQARVAQGRLETLRLSVPAGLEVVSVEGPIAGWTVEQPSSTGAPTLVITPLEPVETTLAVDLALEGHPAASFASPLLLALGSHRTLLLTRAAPEGDALLRVAEPGAARTATAAEKATLPGALRGGAPLLAILDSARPPRWEAEWPERAEVLAAQVDRLLVDAAVGESGRAAYQLWAEVRNRGAQQLVLTLPPGFELVDGSRDGEPVAAGAGAQGLVVPLAGGEQRQVIHVAGVLPLSLAPSRGELALLLPALSAPAARVEVRLLLPGGHAYALADETRGGGVGAPPDCGEAAARRNAVTANVIAQQIRMAAALPPTTGALFARPPGFAELQAVWSAVSASPAPLALRIRSHREETPWF